MGLPGSLAMLVALLALSLLLWLPGLMAQPANPALGLDALLQDYAYRAFVRPRTGVPYEAVVPANLTGIKVSAMRLRTGSLRRKGVPMYNEFMIPPGVVAAPYVERLVFVYQNLGNWSSTYYPLQGYTHLTPVLGLLAYDASNLSATNLPELDVRAYGDPIRIKFLNVALNPDGPAPKCVSFDLHGLPSFSNASDNVCSTVVQGHFSIVVESIAPSPAPVSPIPPTPAAPRAKKKNKSKVWIVVGSVLGGSLLLVLLLFLILWVHKLKQRKKMQQMERAAEVGEALKMTPVGETKAPAATVTRTQPTLENEYVP
ncbi:hypothetical protein Tsubulata_000085 [Turnera subulata]|uniref:Malectin-like domain-containing protein n=1 Tax=Turnera subulata TaxID=218843 RepID=A0A9Q0FJD5_9ROSI|nr:hypothetical protein Tsubulata_000085 [Turnera subulata]